MNSRVEYHLLKLKHVLQRLMVTSRSNAVRLLMTEVAAINSKANQAAFAKLGSPYYEIFATLDTRPSALYRMMDGKKFDMEDYELEVTAPPFHPNCRTTTIPSINDEIEREIDGAVGKMARDPKTEKSHKVKNLSYDEWYNKYLRDTKLDSKF